jgi:hypothetical protein
MPSLTGNVTHDANVFNAESARQTAMAGTPTVAQAATADALYAHTVLTSAIKNGIQPGAAICTLYELGLRS